jgi:hypothetical protein
VEELRRANKLWANDSIALRTSLRIPLSGGGARATPAPSLAARWGYTGPVGLAALVRTPTPCYPCVSASVPPVCLRVAFGLG